MGEWTGSPALLNELKRQGYSKRASKQVAELLERFFAIISETNAPLLAIELVQRMEKRNMRFELER